MIEKIIKIKAIGLLHRGVPQGALNLAPITLVYSENGRGKSTMAAVFRSLACGDASEVSTRQTLDSTDLPEFSCRYIDSSGVGTTIDFQNNAWSATCPDVIVFDTAFVNRNVYSGFDVVPSHRQSLLEFAIGEESVALKNDIDAINVKMDEATKKRSAAEKTLTLSAKPLTLETFIGLENEDGIDTKLAELRSSVEAAKVATRLLQRQSPGALDEFSHDSNAIFTLLARDIPSVEKDTEEKVRSHFQNHQEEGFEEWLANGQCYATQEDCPYCGQNLDGVALVQAYQSFFNEEYSVLKQKVSLALENLDTDLPESLLITLSTAADTNTAQIEAWSDHVPSTAPTLNNEVLKTNFAIVKSMLFSLIRKKSAAPLESIGTAEDKQTIADALVTFDAEIQRYNGEIAKIVERIDAFKAKIAAESVTSIESKIHMLEGKKRRYQEDIMDVVEEYFSAITERKGLDGEKATARERLDTQMNQTLSTFQVSINELLIKFGAQFSIEGMRSSYTGGEPRTEYVLKMRGKVVKLASSRPDEPTFARTLSEGDKRTLAFAFFLAKVDASPNLSQKILVIDDPVASLDLNRRDQSIRAILKLAQSCKQVIVLSHEPYFLREVSKALVRLKPAPIIPAIKQISRVENDYSAFDDCVLDEVCADNYTTKMCKVDNFIHGRIPASREVGEAIRHMLEGYYHRRFPLYLRSDRTLGDIIAEIRGKQAPHPLSHVVPLLEEIAEINDYITNFHHDNEQAEGTGVTNTAELLQFAQRAMRLVHEQG